MLLSQDVLQERGMLAHFASLNKLLQRNSASADHTESEEVQDGCNGQNSGSSLQVSSFFNLCAALCSSPPL